MSRRVASSSVAFASLCAVAAGCSLSLDARRHQCTTDRDCRDSPDSMCVNSWCEPEPKWGCLADPSGPTGERGPFPVTLHARDIVTQEPMSGVSAKLCRKLDPACDMPHGEVLTNEEGNVQFSVEVNGSARAFSGYVEFTRSDLMPGLYFFNPPIDRPVDVPVVQLLSEPLAEGLTLQIGSKYEASRGLILLTTFDCSDAPASGISLELEERDALSDTFYAVDGLPAPSATETDASGYAGVINAPPGNVTLTGRLAADQRVIGRVSVFVKPGTITYSRLGPVGY